MSVILCPRSWQLVPAFDTSVPSGFDSPFLRPYLYCIVASSFRISAIASSLGEALPTLCQTLTLLRPPVVPSVSPHISPQVLCTVVSNPSFHCWTVPYANGISYASLFFRARASPTAGSAAVQLGIEYIPPAAPPLFPGPALLLPFVVWLTVSILGGCCPWHPILLPLSEPLHQVSFILL